LLPSAPYNVFKMLQSIQIYPDEIRWHQVIPARPPNTKALLFLSCMALSSYSRIQTTLDIMQAIDPDFQSIGGLDFCCGFLDVLAGGVSRAENYINRLISAMGAFQTEVFVVDCASCYGWLRDLNTLSPLPFKFQHLTQYIDDHLTEIEFPVAINKTITLHDACHFGRQPEEYQPVRNILRQIPGVEILEMKHHHDKTLCCGAPAGSYQPDLAQSARKKRLNEAAEVNPDFLMTTCDGCFAFSRQAGNAYPFEIVKFLDIFGQAFNLKREDRLHPFYACKTKKEALELAQGRIWESMYSTEEMTAFLGKYFGYKT
jgi:Fe-S oxidoreductase